jgi:hypothetical protein
MDQKGTLIFGMKIGDNGKAGIGAPDVSGKNLQCLLSFLEYIDVHRFRGLTFRMFAKCRRHFGER